MLNFCSLAHEGTCIWEGVFHNMRWHSARSVGIHSVVGYNGMILLHTQILYSCEVSTILVEELTYLFHPLCRT